MKIRTNKVPREILSGFELTDKERKEFDYLSEDELSEQRFARYRDWVYDLGDMMAAPESLKGWDAAHADSYFSGVLFKYTDDFERVICATYFC